MHVEEEETVSIIVNSLIKITNEDNLISVQESKQASLHRYASIKLIDLMHLIWSSRVTCGCVGHYVPQLAAAILEGNKISSNKKINLQGMAVRVFVFLPLLFPWPDLLQFWLQYSFVYNLMFSFWKFAGRQCMDRCRYR